MNRRHGGDACEGLQPHRRAEEAVGRSDCVLMLEGQEMMGIYMFNTSYVEC
jgi:hypothetical protein